MPKAGGGGRRRGTPAGAGPAVEPEDAVPAPGLTGSYLILLPEGDDEMRAGAQALHRVAGLEVAHSRDFQKEPLMAAFEQADTLVFDELGVAVSDTPPDQVQALSGIESASGILAVEPERIVYAIGDLPRAPGVPFASPAPPDVRARRCAIAGIIADRGSDLGERHPWAEGRTLGEALLEPTRIYVRSLLPLVQQGRIKGLAHITGGGLLENIPRVLPEGRHAFVDAGAWAFPPIFELLSEGGNVEPAEMVRTFNCGIGMVAIVGASDAGDVRTRLEGAGETVFEIGRIEEGPRGCTVNGPHGAWTATHNA